MGLRGQRREELWALWDRGGKSCGHCGARKGTAVGTVGQGMEQLLALWDKEGNNCGHYGTREGTAVGIVGQGREQLWALWAGAVGIVSALVHVSGHRADRGTARPT